jgi:hypothetical protein
MGGGTHSPAVPHTVPRLRPSFKQSQGRHLLAGVVLLDRAFGLMDRRLNEAPAAVDAFNSRRKSPIS